MRRPTDNPPIQLESEGTLQIARNRMGNPSELFIDRKQECLLLPEGGTGHSDRDPTTEGV